MKVRITEDCISCQHCVDVCPEVFEMGETLAQVKVSPVPKDQEALARQAADECPTSAIIVE
jgi:ferredoxin